MDEVADAVRILHVDDESEFIDMVASFLEREDDRLTVEAATTAQEALERLSDADIDCIVSDYQLAGTNGIELLRAVRDSGSDLPFVLYTGRGSEQVASEAISAGVSDYLQKEGGTGQYAVLANRIINLVTKHRGEIRIEQFTRLREESDEYRDRLFEIVSTKGRSLDETMQDLLTLGCERFGVENGHLVIIDEDLGRHNVISVAGSDVVSEGVSDLSTTYCRRTIESEEHQEVYNAIEQGWESDPAYQTYGLGCYLGSKLTIGEDIVGTVCFVDEDPREEFTHHERGFLDMLVNWFTQLIREQQLQQAETVFTHAQNGIFVVDVSDESTFTVKRVNPAYERLTGMDPAAVCGRAPRHLATHAETDVEKRCRECVAQGDTVEYEQRLGDETSKRRRKTTLTPIVENGRVIRIVGEMRDIADPDERSG